MGLSRVVSRPTWLRCVLLIGLVTASSPSIAVAVKIVALGASDTAGPFVSSSETYPAQLEAALRSAGYDVSIENAGRSGDTTEYIRRRAAEATQGAQIVLLQPGGNDQLGGRLQGGKVLDPTQTAANIDAIVKDLRGRGIQVLMFQYAGGVGSDVASRYGAVFLGGFFQDVPPSAISGTHMKAEGYAIVVSRILPQVKAAVDQVLHH
jgi:acyl-CoA thioesterase-1